MIHPATEVRAAGTKGVGVFATEDIPKGTVLWVLDRFDRVLAPSAVQAWPQAIRSAAMRFGYLDPLGSLVVCWDHGRLMNHSCDPTSIGVGHAFEIARREIRPGDELTCDYGMSTPTEALQCACGVANCRGVISGAAPDVLATWQIWTADAFRAALGVPQPLLPFAYCAGGDVELLTALQERRPVALPPLSTFPHPPGRPSAGVQQPSRR